MRCVISRMDPCPSDQYRRNVVQSRLHHGTHHQPRARPSRSDGSMTRVGIGYDSHRFTSSRPLILGGVTIPHSHGLAGHSDADAICHSLTDALLGAAGLGDIGQLFPDTDPAWKDADSLALLAGWFGRTMGWYSAGEKVGFLASLVGAIVILLVIDMSFGLVNRYAPQLNVFALAMPIKSWVATWILLLMLGVIIEVIVRELGHNQGLLERLQQVFWNLLSNAVKFTERNGRVRAKAYQHGSVLRIEVSDDGEGIRPEALAYVFDPFRQAEGGTTRSHGGLGLGLAVVRRLVELHGGRVTAESAGLGQGSTFTVELPIGPLQVQGAADEGVVRAARASLRAGASNHELKEATILVVDDEPDARELIAILVKGAGGQVRTASSSADAMTQLATETVDLIVSDIGMPDEDGYAFVRRVRGLDGPAGRVPVIALTAYAREQERTRALAAGFDAHLSKPIAPDRLLGLIATLLKSHAQSA